MAYGMHSMETARDHSTDAPQILDARAFSIPSDDRPWTAAEHDDSKAPGAVNVDSETNTDDTTHDQPAAHNHDGYELTPRLMSCSSTNGMSQPMSTELSQKQSFSSLSSDAARAEQGLTIISQSERVLCDGVGDIESTQPEREAQLEVQNGRIAWTQAVLAVLIVFNCWGWANTWGLFQAYYERYYIPGTPPGQIAWIGSTQLALTFGLGVPVGRAVDNGHFRVCFHGGAGIMMLGLFMSSFCQSWVALWLVQGLLTGIGMGCLFTSGLFVLLEWFDDRKIGLAMGMAAAGSCVGGVVFILLARHLLPEHGFGDTMRTLSGVTFLTMILPNMLYRPRLLHRPKGQHTERRDWRQRLRGLIDVPYLLAMAGMFFSFIGLYFGFVYIITYAAETLRLSDTAATDMLVFMLLANIPGRLIPGLISDKLSGPLNAMIVSTFFSSIVIWAWLSNTSNTQTTLTVIACFYGLVSGGIQALYAPVSFVFCKHRSNTGPAQITVNDRIGVKAGGLYSAIGLAVLVGTPLGGALLSYRLDRGLDRPYLGAQVFAGISLMLGACLLTTSRVARFGLGWKRA